MLSVQISMAVLPLLLASKVQATHFVYGHQALHRTRMDAILNFGEVAPHVHVFSGSNAIDASMTRDSIESGDCTTAPISVDKSGYWAPTVYYKWRNGTYSAIQGDGIVTYWLYHGLKEGELPAVIPDDFRMIAGDPKRDSFDPDAAQAITFQCFDNASGRDLKLPYIPADIECGTIRPQAFFPNCWNGIDSYKPDNSHVAYGEGNPEYGKCPEGWKRIPSLFLETYIKPGNLGPEYEWYPGCFVLSNGDNFGLTFHADWMNGFPKGLLVDAYQQCPNMGGRAEDCPLLAEYINPNKDKCQLKGQVVNEPIGLDAPLAKLPGNNPEFNSSGKAKPSNPYYVESAKLVTYDLTNGGGCLNQRCTDYRGPRDGSGAGPAPTKPDSAASNTTSNPMPSGEMGAQPMSQTSDSAVNTINTSRSVIADTTFTPGPGGVTVNLPGKATKPTTTTRIGEGMNAPPQSTDSVGEEEEMVCMKRKKRRLPGAH